MTASIKFDRADGDVEFFNGTATTGQTTIAVNVGLTATTTVLTGGTCVCVPITGSTAVALPLRSASPITVANYAATAVTLLVYSAWDPVAGAGAGGKIQNGGTNSSFAVAQNKTAVFYPHPNGIDWSVTLSA